MLAKHFQVETCILTYLSLGCLNAVLIYNLTWFNLSKLCHFLQIGKTWCKYSISKNCTNNLSASHCLWIAICVNFVFDLPSKIYLVLLLALNRLKLMKILLTKNSFWRFSMYSNLLTIEDLVQIENLLLRKRPSLMFLKESCHATLFCFNQLLLVTLKYFCLAKALSNFYIDLSSKHFYDRTYGIPPLTYIWFIGFWMVQIMIEMC